MLNPSTADEVNNDPTIRRCISFAEKHACTDLYVVNLFALRATDPRELKKHRDPIGEQNDDIIDKMIFRIRAENGFVVAAWGAHPMAQERGRQLTEKHGPFVCLGTTKGGAPRHPLYVKSKQKFMEYL